MQKKQRPRNADTQPGPKCLPGVSALGVAGACANTLKDGTRFIGCTRYPNCFWSGPYDENEPTRGDKKPMPRKLPAPWRAEQTPSGYVVKDANGQALCYNYSRETESDAQIAKVLTEDEARRIAANIAKLPILLKAP